MHTHCIACSAIHPCAERREFWPGVLKPGGTFIGVTTHPEKWQRSVGQKMTDGESFDRGFRVGNVMVPLTNYFYHRETYEAAFKAAGFAPVEWLPFEVSPEGRQLHSDAWWQDDLQKRRIIMFRCTKR